MIVYVEKPKISQNNNTLYNEDHEYIKDNFIPNFSNTKNLEEVISILKHMSDNNLFIMNNRYMVFDCSALIEVINEIVNVNSLNGIYNSYLVLQLTRTYHLRQTVVWHIFELEA
jgi:hypothetical protein